MLSKAVFLPFHLLPPQMVPPHRPCIWPKGTFFQSHPGELDEKYLIQVGDSLINLWARLPGDTICFSDLAQVGVKKFI